jgi:hypothetical protein
VTGNDLFLDPAEPEPEDEDLDPPPLPLRAIQDALLLIGDQVTSLSASPGTRVAIRRALQTIEDSLAQHGDGRNS